MRNSLKRIFTLTIRNFKEIIRDPLSLIFTIALPLLMEVLFYLLFHDKTDQFEMKYLAPGIVAFSQAFLTLFVGLMISLDRSSSFLTRLYVSKAKSHEFILSYAFSVIPVALAQSLLFFLVGGIFDKNIFCINLVYAILLSILTSTFFIGLGILFGCLFNEKAIGGIASIAISGQSLLSGMWFPLEGMSGGFITFMNCLPFRNASMLLTNSLNGVENMFNDFWLPLIVVVAYSIAVVVTAILVFKHKMSAK